MDDQEIILRLTAVELKLDRLTRIAAATAAGVQSLMTAAGDDEELAAATKKLKAETDALTAAIAAQPHP